MKKKKVLVVAGPTAVGKTALGIELAQKFNGEIISGDSLQIYKKLNIGTAKATLEEQAQAVHHLIDVREISEKYSAANFQQEGRAWIDRLTDEGKLPIVVGGTGLYIQSLLEDYSLGGKEEASSEREKYEVYEAERGKEALWQLLQERDMQAAEKIHANNSRRVIRALEVFEKTGRSILEADGENSALYDSLILGLTTDRALLYERINQRVDTMAGLGLLEEAKTLFELTDVQASQGIGYKELFPYFRGEIDLEEALELIKRNSRRYAKRQLTWFRNRMEVSWWNLVEHPEELEKLEKKVSDWLES
ncbi:MAG: tRNA (adenosine(37)-N6)-dimethylallyltransferase MiaA [Lactobacillales bacterium]|nr:tRNA (adenosine(37)-N6)-dimethylallyltransferase MiaA [Lactobacillales bacterium]